MATGLGRLDDPDGYLTLARSMAGGHGFLLDGRPTAYRPPLYPILLIPVVGMVGRVAWPWGVGILHLALGIGTVVLTHRGARGLGLSPVRSLVASAIVALDPVLVFQSRSVMTETPAAFLVAATLWAFTLPGLRGQILGGLGLGLASLCRPSLLAWVSLIGPGSLGVGPGRVRARVVRSALILSLTVATLAPWAARNALIFGEPIWTTTHGGYTMALANNTTYYADVLDGPPGAVWTGPNQDRWFASIGPRTIGMTEPEADRALRDSVLELARERPWTFVRASVARLGRFWGLAPSGAVYPRWLRLATAAWTAPLWMALILGMARAPILAWPGMAAPSLVVALTAVHLVFWTDLRMRAPLVPAIALIAAGASVTRGTTGRGTPPISIENR